MCKTSRTCHTLMDSLKTPQNMQAVLASWERWTVCPTSRYCESHTLDHAVAYAVLGKTVQLCPRLLPEFESLVIQAYMICTVVGQVPMIPWTSCPQFSRLYRMKTVDRYYHQVGGRTVMDYCVRHYNLNDKITDITAWCPSLDVLYDTVGYVPRDPFYQVNLWDSYMDTWVPECARGMTGSLHALSHLSRDSLREVLTHLDLRTTVCLAGTCKQMWVLVLSDITLWKRFYKAIFGADARCMEGTANPLQLQSCIFESLTYKLCRKLCDIRTETAQRRRCMLQVARVPGAE